MRMPRTVTLALALLLPPVAAGGSEGRLPDAAQAGDHAAVARLLRAGADVDERAADDTTALHWAAYRGDAELAALLLAAGADPNAANRNGATPLGMACVSAGSGRGGRPDLVARLLRAGADPTLAPVGEPPLLTCARTGDAGAVRALLAHGAEVDAADTWRGQTALMWAAAENHTVVLGELLEAGAAVDSASTGGFTALLFAVRQDARESVRLLLSAGADPGVAAPNGQTALRVAIANRHYTVAGLLLAAGADPTVRDRRGNTALHELVTSRSPARHLGNQFVAFNREDPTQLASLELMDRLLEAGADPDARTEPVPIRHERWTDEGIFSAGRPFMDNRVNLGGATPYLLAAQAADVAAMRRLAERGADPRLATYANNTAVMLAAGVGHVEGSRRFRPESEALAAVRLALDAGVDVNAGNANGQTALHGAVYRAADTIIRHLVDAGARMDFADELDRTALDLAEQGFNQVASLIRRDRSAALLRSLGAKSSRSDAAASADR